MAFMVDFARLSVRQERVVILSLGLMTTLASQTISVMLLFVFSLTSTQRTFLCSIVNLRVLLVLVVVVVGTFLRYTCA